MLITLYGADSYRRLRKLKEIVDTYTLKQGNFSKERFPLVEKEDLDKLRGFLSGQSMFSSKKLVILDEPFEFEDAKALKELLKEHNDSKETTILISTTKKHPATFKFIEEEPNKFEEFALLKGRDLNSFIKKEADRWGVPLEAREISSIADSLGSDTWKIATELEQIALKAGKKVDAERFTLQAEYFPSLNILKRGGSVGERLVALEKLIGDRGDDPGRV
ncbi:MAG: hypothetical protein NUV96_01450, partial [Candidatus Colwellbacteria bacterium]|nr:hypothetical protein [Candidatus Colwellbacteria bacterium]